MTELNILNELLLKLEGAVSGLTELRDNKRFDSAEYHRLSGKIEGVKLVDSYIRDEISFAKQRAAHEQNEREGFGD